MHSGINGKLMQYINSRNLVNISLEQSYSYFIGYDRSVDFQASGAYVFRPNGSFPVLSEEKVPFTVFRGPLFDEVHQMINSWIYQITRVYKEKKHAEFEFVVGPILVDDGFGKEIVTHIKSKIETKKYFIQTPMGVIFLNGKPMKFLMNMKTRVKLNVNMLLYLKMILMMFAIFVELIKRGIETIIEYNFFKVSPKILGRMPESRKIERFQLVEEHWVLQCRLLSGI